MTTNDMMFNAVEAVVVVGNPRHNKGLKSNYDVDGGKSTEMSFGLQSFLPPIPTRWDDSGKVLDVCALRDGVCDAASGTGIGPQHFCESESLFSSADLCLYASHFPHTVYTASNWTQSQSTKLMTSAFEPVASPTQTGQPQSDAAVVLSGSAPAVFAAAAAVGFGALLTFF